MGDRWTLLILRDLFISSSCRYVELRESLTGVSPTLLSQRIKDLINNGLIEQCEKPGTGHIAYRLTPRGPSRSWVVMAEEVGFEPTVAIHHNGFRDRPIFSHAQTLERTSLLSRM